MEEQKKRKTVTSNEVKLRYKQKTYVQYVANFRREEDADLINMIETEKAKGMGTTDAFRSLLRKSEK